MIITALLLAIILTGKIRSDAINHFIEDAVDPSSPRITRALTPADLEVAMTGERYEHFHQFVQDSVVPERTARIKLWAKDGTVIYSDDPTQVGERFPNKLNLMKAFEGETPIAIKVPENVDNDRERRLGTLVSVCSHSASRGDNAQRRNRDLPILCLHGGPHGRRSSIAARVLELGQQCPGRDAPWRATDNISPRYKRPCGDPFHRLR